MLLSKLYLIRSIQHFLQIWFDVFHNDAYIIRIATGQLISEGRYYRIEAIRDEHAVNLWCELVPFNSGQLSQYLHFIYHFLHFWRIVLQISHNLKRHVLLRLHTYAIYYDAKAAIAYQALELEAHFQPAYQIITELARKAVFFLFRTTAMVLFSWWGGIGLDLIGGRILDRTLWLHNFIRLYNQK